MVYVLAANGGIFTTHRKALLLGLLIALLCSCLDPAAQASPDDVLTFTPAPLAVATTKGATSTAEAPHVVLQTLNIPAVLSSGVPLTITSTWSLGGAPIDSPREIVYQLRKSGTSVAFELVSNTYLSDTLGANTFSVSDEFWLTLEVEEGLYTLSVLVRDPLGESMPLALAIVGVQPDGSYLLGSVNIAGEKAASLGLATYKTYLPLIASTNAFTNVFISTARIQAIRQAVSDKRAPNYEAYKRLLYECNNAVEETPSPPRTLYVPPFYEDPDGHGRAKEAVKKDSNNAYGLALCYRITGNNIYAQSATHIISTWSTTLTRIDTRDDSTLVFSYHFPAMIFAADLLRGSPSYTREIDQKFVSFLKDIAIQGSSMNTVSRAGCGYKAGIQLTNNWSNWGIVLAMSVGVFTGDKQLYAQTIQKWQSNIGIQVDEQGNLQIEGRRNNCSGDTGLHYTNYAMQPLTIAAEIAYNNGTDLYQDQRYQRAVHRTAEVDRYPSRFPFYQHSDSDYTDTRYKVAWLEIARNHVADANADWLLQQFQPVTTSEIIRFATLTHGSLEVRKTGK